MALRSPGYLREKEILERNTASLHEPALQPVLPHIPPHPCMLPSEPLLSCVNQWVSMFPPPKKKTPWTLPSICGTLNTNVTMEAGGHAPVHHQESLISVT